MKEKMIKHGKFFMVLIINVLVISMVYFANDVYALSKIGSQGEEVKSICNTLSEQGYFNGKIDGIFGEQTKSCY